MPASLVAFLLLLLTLAIVPSFYFLLLSTNKKKPAPPQRHGASGDGRSLPSPPGLPLLGHLHLLGSLPHQALRSLARTHGPVLLLRFGRVPTVLVSSVAAAEEVMRTRDLAFASRPRSVMAERLLYGRDVAFAPYGEYWRQARRICVVHLLNARRIMSFRRVREQEAAALVARVRAAGAIDLGDLLVEDTNTVVSRAALGDENARGLFDDGHGGRAHEQRKVFSDFQKLLGTEPVGELLPWLGWVDAMRGLEGKIKRTFEALDGLLEKVIEDHRRRSQQVRQNGDDVAVHRDFVDVLLDVHNHDDEEHGIRLETDEIKAIILDMFAAGTDTTSAVMEWAMAELVTHPRAMRKVQDEVRSTFGAVGGVTEEDHLQTGMQQLQYLTAVIKETLRLLVPREPPADAEILGYHVPARTRVVINAWAIARDPATWEDADEFVPERFLGSAAAVDFKGQDFELVPFGAGRRMCPGAKFAEATVAMGLASLLYHFDWETASGKKLDMREMNGLSIHIKHGLPLKAKP